MNCLTRNNVSFAIVALFLVRSVSLNAEVPDGDNLSGHKGLLHSVAANNHPKGWVTLGTDFQIYSTTDLWAPGVSHSRFVNSYSIGWTPFSFLESTLAMHITSDSTSSPSSEELQVAVGDLELSVKGGAEIGSGFSLGGLFDVRFNSGNGFFKAGSGSNFFFAALATWNTGPTVPLNAHLNFGFLLDGSANLFDDLSKLTSAQLHAAQISSYNRLSLKLGLEYITQYLNPFVEFSLEPFLGEGAPSFGESPGVLSLGLKVWPTKGRSLQLMAAIDVGMTGIGNNSSLETPTGSGKYAFVTAPWNLLFRASYRFDPFAKPKIITKTIPVGGSDQPKDSSILIDTAQSSGIVVGDVLDGYTGEPILNARIEFTGQDVSKLVVDRKNGSFRSFRIPTGPQQVVAFAHGYEPAKVQVVVPAQKEVRIKITLEPKLSFRPGTIRGIVKTLRGKTIPGATILLPQLDRQIVSDANGDFLVNLKPGNYKLVISASGYRTQQKDIKVEEGSTVILNVELLP
ncbi:MAG: carboxypeptidase-like regulatory domain-containing protein [Pseudomonadota bacterium]